MAVADVFDALTSHRPYRKPAPTHEVLEYIMANAGTHFDEEIVRAFLKRVAPFPVGSHVRLSNGKRGIVVKNYREQPLRPLIAIIDEDISYDLFQDPKYFNLIVTGVEELDNISVPPSNSRS
ncbi:MAG: HD-GYP domain-containing protein, partial [Oscillospiraceae bacterium]